MRNFNFLRNLTISVFLFSTFNLFGQEVIIEHSNVLPDSPFKIRTNFDQQNYTTVLNENGMKIYVANQTGNQNTPTTGSDEINENVYLSINLEFDLNVYFPAAIEIYDESGHRTSAYFIGENPVTVEVPQGTYDVFCRFYDMISGRSAMVIKEQQNISEDITITMNSDEATNHVSINTYDENGQPLEPGVYNPEIELNSGMIFNRMLHFRPSDLLILNENFIWEFAFDDEPVWNFYINDVSERYSVLQSFIGYGSLDDVNYFCKLPSLNGINESISIENNPEEYVFHTENFRPGASNTEGVYPGFFTWVSFADYTTIGWGVSHSVYTINPEEGFKGYLNNPFEEGSGNLLVYPSVVDHIVVDPEWGDEYPYLIKGNPVFLNDGEIHYGSGNTSNYFFTENGLKELPFHSKFTFTKENTPDIQQGGNTPISVITPYLIPNEMNFISLQYKGFYGEVRESDFFNTQIEAKYNGNIIYSGSYTNFNGFPANGQIELTLINTNAQIEDFIGKNTTKISYNASEADIPPTLQMLQFRDPLQSVTNIFESPDNVSVRLAAGDFQYDTVNGIFIYNEGNNVEFYYSLRDQENWTELELTKYSEYFQAPGFGDYYEGSLESVYVPENNSWFDVKVICTDAAGNKQEQIVSPAFQIHQATMGIEETDKSGFAVYPNPFTNELNIQLPEGVKGNYNFKITDLNGKTVYSQNRNADSAKSFMWNGSSFPKGIYLLSIENNGKVIARKVIKK